jgi:hypothetical protein
LPFLDTVSLERSKPVRANRRVSDKRSVIEFENAQRLPIELEAKRQPLPQLTQLVEDQQCPGRFCLRTVCLRGCARNSGRSPAGASNRAPFLRSGRPQHGPRGYRSQRVRAQRGPSRSGTVDRYGDPKSFGTLTGSARLLARKQMRNESRNFAFGHGRTGVRSALRRAHRRNRGDCAAYPLLPCFPLPIPPRPCCINSA